MKEWLAEKTPYFFDNVFYNLFRLFGLHPLILFLI